MRNAKSLNRLLLSVVAFLTVNISKADWWDPPKTKDYYSADSNYFVRIVPTFMPEKYPAWREASRKKKRKYSHQDTTIINCHAIMYKRINGKDSLVWKETLINTTAPVSALVSNNGKYMVTFDNWHFMGHGVNVLVVYDSKGMLIKRHNLEEISPFPINRYFISISSIWWRCGAEFVDEKNIKLCFSDKDKNMESRNYSLLELKIK